MKKIILIGVIGVMYACGAEEELAEESDQLLIETQSVELEDDYEPENSCRTYGTPATLNSAITVRHGHSRSNFGDSLVSFYGPMVWTLGQNDMDTLYVEIQLPVNTEIQTITKRFEGQQQGYANDVMFLTLGLAGTSAAAPASTHSFRYLIPYCEWDGLDYYIVQVGNKKKKIVAANEDVQPDKKK